MQGKQNFYEFSSLGIFAMYLPKDHSFCLFSSEADGNYSSFFCGFDGLVLFRLLSDPSGKTHSQP